MKMKILTLTALLVLTISNVNAQWAQIGQDIDGASDNDYSGKSVSISADGSIVAIG